MNTTPPAPPVPPHPFGAPPPPPPPPPPHRPPWRFVRRERGRMIAGVATGMADAFGIDVVIMRVIWVVLALASFGIGIAAYAICWLAFPSDEHPAPLSEIKFDRESWRLHNAGLIVGVALLGIGLVIVFGEVFPPFRHSGDVAWATVLIASGLGVLLVRHNHLEGDDFDNANSAEHHYDRPAGGTQGETVAEDAAPDDTIDVPEAGDASDTDPAGTPTAGSAPPAPPVPPSAWSQSAPWPTAPQPRVRRPRRRPFLTPITIGLLLIGAGVVTLLDNTGTTHITGAQALAGAAGVIGLVLVLSTWFGRAHGLIPIGIIVLLAAVPATLIDVPITGGIGNHRYEPISRAELQRTYEHGIGLLDLDLRSVPLAGETTRVATRLGIGELQVDVPSTVRVVIDAHAGVGAIHIFGSAYDNQMSPTARVAVPGTGDGVLYLDARVGAGNIRIRRFDANGAETFPAGVYR